MGFGGAQLDKRPPMGGLPPGVRTPLMNEILRFAKEVVGRQPAFFNVSKKAVGLKWELRPTDDPRLFNVVTDRLYDEGFTATMEQTDNTAVLERNIEGTLERSYGYPTYVAGEMYPMTRTPEQREELRQALVRNMPSRLKRYITITITD